MHWLKYEEAHRSEWIINLKANVKIELKIDVVFYPLSSIGFK